MKHTPPPLTLTTVPTQVGVCHKIGPLPPYRGTQENYACVYADYAESPQLLAYAQLMTASPEMLEALKLVLMFHSGAPWTDERRLDWVNGLTRLLGPAMSRRERFASDEATTKNLCDAVRAAIAKAEGTTNQSAASGAA